MTQRNIPQFNSEEEEANWWYDHRDETAEWMAEAFEKGETTTLAAALERRRLKLSARRNLICNVPSISMKRWPMRIAHSR